MNNLAISSSKPLRIAPKWIVFAIVVVSFIGFLDATYLTVKHYLGTPVSCSILEGCETVTTSQYSTVGGMPVALFGAIYYLVIFALIIAYLDIKRDGIITFIARLTVVGFLASLWFSYLQLFVLKALCLYCLISIITSTLLFAIGLFLIRSKKQKIKLG